MASRSKSEALLAGRIFDDRGNRMTPSHARKGGITYRYYVSSALIQGQAEGAVSISRASAAELDALVVDAVRNHFNESAPRDDRELISAHLSRCATSAAASVKSSGAIRCGERMVCDVDMK